MARETPNPARARERLCPRAASAPGIAASRLLHSLGEASRATARPSLAAPGLTRPGPCLTRRVPAATPKRTTTERCPAQRSEHRAGRSEEPAARSPSERLRRSRPALTAPHSRYPALAPTPPGRRSAPPPSCSRPGGGAAIWRRGGRRERRWRSRSRGGARTSC